MNSIKYITYVLGLALLLSSCETNEPPIISDQKFDLYEGYYYQYWEAFVEATDPDGDRNLTFSIIDGNEEGVFGINPETGRLLVMKPESLNYETQTQYFLKVAVSDNHKKYPLESSAMIRIQVLDRREVTDQLVAYYNFNEDASDQSPNQQHGIVYGAQIEEGRDDDSQTAFLFDGRDDYIRFPDRTLFSYPKGNLTITFWVQAHTHRDTSYLISKGAGDQDREYALGINTDSLFFFRVHDRGNPDVFYEAVSTTRVNYSDWYHVAGAWDGHMLHIYVNGQLEDSRFCDHTAGNYGSDLFAGTSMGSNSETSLHGIMDDLIIYHRILTPTEILRLFHWPISEWWEQG